MMDETNGTPNDPAGGEGGAPAPEPPAPVPPAPEQPVPAAPAPEQPPAAHDVPVPGAQPAAASAQQPPGPAVGAAKPKSKKTLYIVLGIVAVLILCGVGSCVVGGATFIGTQQNKDDLITTAEVHMAAAAEILVQVDEDWVVYAESESDQPTDAQAQIEAATADSIDQARAELDAASAAIEELPDSTFKTEYTFAIGAFNQSLDAYEMLYSGLGDLMVLSTELETLGGQIDEAVNTLDDAVESNNDNDYSDGKSEAEAAKKSFETIAARYDQLAGANPDAELEKMAAIARKQAEKAGYVVEAAEAGKAGRTSAYNDVIDEYNDANSAVRDMPLPYWAADTSLLTADAEAIYAEASDLAQQAQDSWEAAWEAYDAGEY